MNRTTRRDFAKRSLAAGVTLGLPALILGDRRIALADANSEIRVAIIGLGGLNIPGSVGGRGRQLIAQLRKIPGVRIAAICDVDQSVLDHSVQEFKDRGQEVVAYHDLRQVFDDKSIDAVFVALPNHWHCLAAVWACQAGKDVYVEKPFSYNIWEGRQVVAAARKYGRMVQAGTQRRSSHLLRHAFEELRAGELGKIRYAHALIYRGRDGMDQVSEPTPVPPTVDYDLWCGPAPKQPLRRKHLHYEWHWFWATGNGEMGNNGVHMIDACRWALGQEKSPPRVISIGGRFAFDDSGETANTQIALWDFRPVPLVCEIRNVRASKAADAMGKFRGQSTGVVIECEGGYFAGDAAAGAMYDGEGKKIKDFTSDQPKDSVGDHLANFIAAVRSRKPEELNCEALEGHLSAACCHLANISYRLGKQMAPGAVLEANRDNAELADALDRCGEYLRANGIELSALRPTAGPWLQFDNEQERFVAEFAEEANALCRRPYRQPFAVPQIA